MSVFLHIFLLLKVKRFSIFILHCSHSCFFNVRKINITIVILLFSHSIRRKILFFRDFQHCLFPARRGGWRAVGAAALRGSPPTSSIMWFSITEPRARDEPPPQDLPAPRDARLGGAAFVCFPYVPFFFKFPWLCICVRRKACLLKQAWYAYWHSCQEILLLRMSWGVKITSCRSTGMVVSLIIHFITHFSA